MPGVCREYARRNHRDEWERIRRKERNRNRKRGRG